MAEAQTLGLGIMGEGKRPEPKKQKLEDGEEEEGPEPKKQKVEDEEEEGEEEEEEASDDDDSSVFNDKPVYGIYPIDDIEVGLRDLYVRYNEVVEKSNGFEAVELPRRNPYFGVIRPIKMDDPEWAEWTEDLDECAEFAVEEYNKGRTKPFRKLTSPGQAEEEGDLVFQKVTKANLQAGGYILYYITFEALNTLSGKPSVFQAKVYFGPAKLKKVLFFSPKKASEDVYSS